MMKIAFIGAGSFGFSRALIRDILTFPLLRRSTLCLMDVNKERLAYIKKAAGRIIESAGVNVKLETTMNRKAALQGADAVLCTILAGDVSIWRHDIEIPKKYGIDTNVGDTRSVSGIFRALRTIPVMLNICHDMEKYCPKALLLNYTNPMAMLCSAMQKASAITVTGLCHSVQSTAERLARWIGADMNEITYTCAGLNHLSWYIKYERNGKDAYPSIRNALKRKAVSKSELVRNELFRQFGYYITESSGHNSEYSAWFRKRPDLIKKYCRASKYAAWNPGEYAFILKDYLRRKKTWKKDIAAWFKADLNLERGNEYASNIINAWVGGEIYKFNGNVKNTGLITNLPHGCCVEVPVIVSKRQLNPVHVGALPPQLAAIAGLTANIEEMAVNAALKGDPEMVFYAVANDPLCSAVLSLEEIRRMVREMLRKNKKHLPQFRRIKI